MSEINPEANCDVPEEEEGGKERGREVDWGNWESGEGGRERG